MENSQHYQVESDHDWKQLVPPDGGVIRLENDDTPHTISFFHAAFEALAVNELRYLQLHEEKYGVNIDVPAAAILSTFGLRAGVSLVVPPVCLCSGT